MSIVEVVEHEGVNYAEIIRAEARVDRSTFFSPPESSFQFGLLAHEAGFERSPTSTNRCHERSRICNRCLSSRGESSTSTLHRRSPAVQGVQASAR